MVAAFDFLDVMAWDVALSAVLLAIGALVLPYDTKRGQVDEKAKTMRIGFAVATGAAGFYLFLSGAIIGFTWPFTLANGVYNVLFGGIATVGGLILLAGSVTLAFNANLKPITYFAGIAGIYGIVDAYSIVFYNLTSKPMLSSLGYLSFVAPAILSVPAAHLANKKWRIVFAAFAFLFAVAWIYQAANFTFAHLKPA